MSENAPQTLVIGGGIGGLTLALHLHARGLPCEIFEAASAYKPLGVGINMMPHAMRELTQLGLEAGLMKRGVEAREFAYFNRHGQFILAEPCGRFAGYGYRHFSIHRGDLHDVLLGAVVDRLGAGAVHMDHRCTGIEQDPAGVTVRFENAEPRTGAVAIGADGFHSAVRRQFYPDEGMQFGGINMWRGVTRRQPFLSGASVTRVGTVGNGKMTIYPIRQFDDGTQLVNWVVEQRRAAYGPSDWATPGRIADFIEPHADWRFDWLDIPEMIGNAEYIFEYPMVDRDPVGRWTHGRVTLLGDAAHPMYPRGGNGGAQAILDAEALARLLAETDDPVAALKAYEDERLEATGKIVLTNRDQPPDHIIETVENLTGGQRFERIEDVIDPAELAAISDRYKEIAGYSVESVGR
jgi:2-polyprenyl-6-methoxyphenol hydroxylase-like FAD-dependent oxidoreductase